MAHISFCIVKCYVVQLVSLLPGPFCGDILFSKFPTMKYLLFVFGIEITFDSCNFDSCNKEPKC